MENKPVNESLFRVWVDTKRRIVSFHEEEGCQLLEFRNRENGVTAPRCLCFSDMSHLYADGLDLRHDGRIEL